MITVALRLITVKLLLILVVALVGCSDQSSEGVTSSNDLSYTSQNPSGELPDDLIDELGLTEEQKEAMEALREEIRARHEEIRAGFDEDTPREEIREALKALHEEARTRMQEILSEEQYALLEQYRQEKGRKFGRGPDGESLSPEERLEKRLQHMTEALQLTDDQVAAIRAIFESYQEEMEAAREARDREAGQELREQIRSEIEALLTDEQIASLEEMKQNRPGPGHGHDGPGRGFRRGPGGN